MANLSGNSPITADIAVCKKGANMLFHVRCQYQICGLLGHDVTYKLVLEFIVSIIDYCNTVLSGLPLHLYSEFLMLLPGLSMVFVRETMSPMH